jgi:hypothetical protein
MIAYQTAFKVIILFLNAFLKCQPKNRRFKTVFIAKYEIFSGKFNVAEQFLSLRPDFSLFR